MRPERLSAPPGPVRPVCYPFVALGAVSEETLRIQVKADVLGSLEFSGKDAAVNEHLADTILNLTVNFRLK